MRTALLLVGFNRTDYFDETLTSLEANEAAHECDLHVYVDGGPNARQEAIRQRIEQTSFERVTVVCREENWGIGRHLIDARRRLFDEQHYDRVLLFEDDMVLAPSYVKTVLAMLDWGSSFSDVGTVMAYNINTDAHEQQRQQLSDVVATNRHFWGYGMTRSVWNDIKPILYEFESRFLQGVSYGDRAHRRIRWRFIRPIMKKPRTVRQGEALVPPSLLTPPFSTWPGKCPTSQDAITALALWHAGYARLTTRVSRAHYIGKSGFSFSPEVYEKMGFNAQNTIEFEDISTTPDAFTLVQTDTEGRSMKPTKYE